MDAESDSATDLDAIRREIDEIDAGLLELLQRRFAISERVRAAKKARGEDGGSPVRPGREAELMRRLIAARRTPLPLDVVVAVWRAILAGSTMLQASTRLHLTAETAGNGSLRDMLRKHFASTPIDVHSGEEDVLTAVGADPGAIGVLTPIGHWPRALAQMDASGLSVSGALPFLAGNPVPDLLVVSHAPAEPTGEDETLILSAGQLPRDFTPAPLWRAKLDGGHWLTSLPGFLAISEMPLVSLTHGNDDLALRVLGRYPSPLAIE